MEYRIWNPDSDTLTLYRLCEYGKTYKERKSRHSCDITLW